jgi:hypothetical protein
VITGNDGIELAAGSAAEDGVAGEWSFDTNSAALRFLDGRAQDCLIF